MFSYFLLPYEYKPGPLKFLWLHPKKSIQNFQCGARALIVLTFGVSMIAPAFLWAQSVKPPQTLQLPSAGTLMKGEASISQSQNGLSAQMTVKQFTPSAVIDWASFNVGQNAMVNFVQPSSNASILNRVNDSNPSQIFGQIKSNGQVFLSNPNGVYFSPSASVDVGALSATTHAITDEAFMSGRYQFQRLDASGSIVNEGQLTAAPGGYIALLAPEVRNKGVIIARAGTVVMASGDLITLNFSGQQTLAGISTTPSTIATLISNGEAIQAPDGQIILSAVGLGRLQAGVINNSGTLEANSMRSVGGRIVLEADQITLTKTSAISATGALGGGTVLVGSDWMGQDGMRQASSVNMNAGALIDASATLNGPGGTVVLRSDPTNPLSTTTVEGQIQAKSGPLAVGGRQSWGV